MKLNRREFLRWLAAVGAGAGAALAGVGIAEAGRGEVETSTTSYLPVAKDWTTPVHEPLSEAHPDVDYMDDMGKAAVNKLNEWVAMRLYCNDHCVGIIQGIPVDA